MTIAIRIRILFRAATRGLNHLTLSLLLLLGIASQAANAQFVHPGGLHSQADLDRMKAQVAAGAHPWIDDWNLLITDPWAQNTYKAAPRANLGALLHRMGKPTAALAGSALPDADPLELDQRLSGNPLIFS